MGPRLFHGMNSLQKLLTDEFRFCCLVPNSIQCLPEPDEFSSCEDLMSNLILRSCIWVLGVIAFLGNIMVIGWRVRYRASNKVHSFLITNLAIGDLLMGVYLMIIACVDSYYRGEYFIHDAAWRQSTWCRMSGFLSTLSSELSVFTLTVITLDRFIAIVYPFKLTRLNIKHTRIIMFCIWAMCFSMAGVPLLDIDYFDNFYGRSGVCLALHVTHQRPNGWEYSVFVFIALNFISFTVIAVSVPRERR